MSDAYIEERTNKTAGACTEEVAAWCIYRLDVPLVKELISFLGAASVTELGAGVGRYARAISAYGQTSSYVAYDGMPGIEERSRGWVHFGDLSNTSLVLQRSDYVLTFETAEHVPRTFQATLLQHIDHAAKQGVIISWSDARRGVGHVNPKRAAEVQHLFCQRGFHLHSIPTKKLRRAGSYWYFRKNILVFQRQPPMNWVNANDAVQMAAQGTDMRTCGSDYSCCRHAPDTRCSRNVTCMTAHTPEQQFRRAPSQ
jgi:hypothetical protein